MAHPSLPSRTRLERLRRQAGALLVDNFFLGAAMAGKLVPLANPRLHGVRVVRDVPYRDTGMREHLLDVYLPPAPHRVDRPAILYLHGGGFRILSKDSHWLFGLAFARAGYAVFNASYRLAPKHCFPAAHEDAAHALAWVSENARRYGVNPKKIVVAGESAGGNLATSLTLGASWERPEPWLKRAFEVPHPPVATMPACGILQVSDPGRFSRQKKLFSPLQDRIDEVLESYLDGVGPCADTDLEMMDPVVVLERSGRPVRPVGPFHVTCGTWDVLVDDSQRLERALHRLELPVEARYYEREPHAFHAFVMRESARRWWRDTFDFLGRHVPVPGRENAHA